NDAEKQIGQMVFGLLGKPADNPEIDIGDAVAGQNEHVSGVRIAMKVAVDQHLAQKSFRPPAGNGFAVDADLLHAFGVQHFDPVDPLHDQHAFRRIVPKNLGYFYRWIIFEVVLKTVDMAAFVDEIKFTP